MTKTQNPSALSTAEDTVHEAGDAPARRPYEPPRIESGDAFEKVVLLSGCNETVFCPVPC